MPLGRYLGYIEKTTNGVLMPLPVTRESLNEKLVYAKIIMRHRKLHFGISDVRLQNIYPIPHGANDKIVCSLKWINTRNRFSLYILQSLLHYQCKYWISGKEADLEPLTFRQFLSLYPFKHLDQSRLSRLASTLFVLTPQNQIIGIRSLFISKKSIAHTLLKKSLKIMKIPLKISTFTTFLPKKRYMYQLERYAIAGNYLIFQTTKREPLIIMGEA
jgi:hypothetical protein